MWEEMDASAGTQSSPDAHVPDKQGRGRLLQQNQRTESRSLNADFAWLSSSSGVGILETDFQSPVELVLRKRWPLGQAVAFPLCRLMCSNRSESGSRGACCIPGTVLGTFHTCLLRSS